MSSDSLLMVAVEIGALNMMRILLTHGAYVNANNVPGYPCALHVACIALGIEKVELLLEFGADVDRFCYTPADSFPTRAIVQPKEVRQVEKMTALHLAISTAPHRAMFSAQKIVRAPVVSALLDFGADVDAADGSGRTALLIASQLGGFVSDEVLLDHGAEIGHKTSTFGTALDAALSHGNLAIAGLLQAAKAGSATQ